ncbi:hypothetical protein BJ912DRAFT_944526 [Pholiota molesta]|nr:hypothetical protein BJ912DRAFT_944526 [Pholiota molesta]
MDNPLSPLSGNLNTSESTEESRRLIDDAIEKHQDSILMLRYQRNGFASTASLPPEILCRIFFFVQIEEDDFDGRLFHKWIKLTHVCRHWRNVAIDSPSLWVIPPLGNFPWAEEMLRRSKGASLVIKADISLKTPVTPALRLALNHGSRIKHLSIQSITLDLWNALQNELPKSAPRLEYLSLRAVPSSWEADGDDSDLDEEEWDPIPVSEAILPKTNRLRHLDLSNCEIDWNLPSSLLHSITHLKLHLLPENSKLNGKQYVDALKAMPSLEFLELDEALPFAMVSESVHLTSLRYYIGVQFFRCITFPPTASINVDCYSTANSSGDFSGIISGLAQSYAAPHLPTLATFQIVSSVEVTFLLSTADVKSEEDNGRVHLFLSLAFSWESSSVEPAFVSRVTNDIFSGANTFGRLLQASIIMVEGGTLSSLAGALQLRPNATAEDAQPITPMKEFYFPNLSAIYIRKTAFRESYLPHSVQCRSDLPIESLRDCLKQRNESRLNIKLLVFNLCTGLSQQDVKMLKDVVHCVKCESCTEE